MRRMEKTIKNTALMGQIKLQREKIKNYRYKNYKNTKIKIYQRIY